MNKIEEIKAKFKESLKVEKLDMNANLRELGLDSLDVVELLLELEDTYNIHFEDTDMANFVTVGDLFKALEEKLG